MSVSVHLPDEYGYVLLCGALMSFSVIIIGFFFAGKARASILTEKYLKQNYGAEHLKEFGSEIKTGGYPDSGSGYYTRNLPYRKWYELNSGQRAHLNYVEFIASNLALLFIAGVYYPVLSAAVGAGIIVARFVYAIGYVSKGPSGRLVGALLNDLFVLAHFIMAVLASINFISGVKI